MTGLTGLCASDETLARSLDAAAAGYADTEERLQRGAAAGPDGVS